MAPIPQATSNNSNNATTQADAHHLPFWLFGLLAIGLVVTCVFVFFLIVFIKRRIRRVTASKVKETEIETAMEAGFEPEDIKTKSPSLIHIPIPDLPLNSPFVSFEWKGVIYSYPSCQASALQRPPPTATQAHDNTDTQPSEATSPEEDSTLEAKVTLQIVEKEEDNSSDIVDRINEYYTDSTTSSYSQISTLAASFWESSDPALPNIRVVDCDGPLPEDPNAEDGYDLEDILLATALSTLNITKDFLPVPEPSFNAPRSKPTFELDSDSESEYDSESDDGRDPLEILCDILDISEDDLDGSFDAQTPPSDAPSKPRTSFTVTAPLRLSKP
ncbi:hypothetical protein NLI96_g8825 [Meripilus lineatus]|uniref:Uncharacterized protein n=1 Tax=Meripilus lineatus TaxID=2056292 RepID=A0AAD5YDL8_9APHY|nr:hypothetical protein NLI96_g8825 [Physisporinus lineatus]